MSKVVNVKQVQWWDDRFYRIEFDDGSYDFYPSATTKLGVSPKPFLPTWYGDLGTREAKRRTDEAADKGTRIHEAWEVMCKGGKVIYNDRKRPIYTEEEIEAFRRDGLIYVLENQEEASHPWKLENFMKEVKPKILRTETTVYSHKYRDAGTLDTLLEISGGEYNLDGKKYKFNGGVYVADLKSGKTVGLDAYRQTSCYFNCVKEMGLCEPAGTLVIHSGNGLKTRTGVKKFPDLHIREVHVPDDFKSYRRLAELWEEENPKAKPTVFEFPTVFSIGVNR